MNRIITLIVSAVVAASGCSLDVPSGSPENPLDGKSIAFVGDSISYGTNFQGGYGSLIGADNNMTVTNTSRGGATLAENVPWAENTEGVRPCISSLLDELEGDFDYIILEGGINDFWAHVELGSVTDGFEDDFDNSTYIGALEALFYNAANKFPDSQKGFVIIHDPFTYDAEEGFEPYYEMTKAVCEKWGVPYLDLYSVNNAETGVNVKDAEQKKLYFASNDRPEGDGCHPNELGYREIYVKPMTQWLKTL